LIGSAEANRFGDSVIVGYPPDLQHEYGGHLCFYARQKSLDEPKWSRRVEEHDVPSVVAAGASGFASDFGVAFMRPLEVFSDVPGTEIVVCFGTRRSIRVLRIYSITGDLLYQFWHDGPIGSVQWNSQAGLLVCAGQDCRRRFDELGISPKETPTRRLYPFSVFAVRPELGQVSPAILDDVADPFSPRSVWYKYICPLNHYDDIEEVNVTSPHTEDTTWDAFRLQIECPEPKKGVISILYTYDGHEASNGREPDTFYQARMASGDGLRIDTFLLGSIDDLCR